MKFNTWYQREDIEKYYIFVIDVKDKSGRYYFNWINRNNYLWKLRASFNYNYPVDSEEEIKEKSPILSIKEKERMIMELFEII